MYAQEWSGSLTEVLEGPQLTAEQKVFAEQYYPYIIQWQEWPDLFLTEIGGLFVVPHQRLMLRAANRGALTNVNVSSRGTAKSATIQVLLDTYLSIMIPNKKLVMLSATGFRGGQMMFADIESFMTGGWDSQRELPYVAACVTKTKQQQGLVHHAPNWWRVNFGSDSHLTTYPTTDQKTIRGIRGNFLLIDEAVTFDPDTLTRVCEPFLNVGGDFEHGGYHSMRNCMFFTTTIDYAWRPFMSTIRAAQAGITRDYDASVALQDKNWTRYDQLRREGLHNFTYVSFDYTDVLIPTVIKTRDGRRMRVKHPNNKLRPEIAVKGIPYTERDLNGNFLLETDPLEFYRTYPINKETIEQSLLAGMVDEAIWLSEQRNVVDNATGDVYAYGMLQRASCEREPLIPYEKCVPAWKEEHKKSPIGFSPSILYTCTDPVVIGVDYAGGDRDFCAFVVIRVGPLAEGVFDPFTGHGYSTWSNVIWCEQHRQMTHRQVADKLWHFMERYPNLAWHYDEFEERDTWKLCRAIGLDMKGGGQGVRDALVYLDQEFIPEGRQRILDPLDQDSRIQGYLQAREGCLPLLDAIQPSDMINDKCVEFTVAQMKVQQLWLPKWIDSSERQGQRELEVGYAGSRTLRHQLEKIQQEPTKLYRKFFMPSSTETIEGKKDMFSAFLYAGKQLRNHIIRFQTKENTVPATVAIRTQIGGRGGRNHGAVGARRW